MNLVWLLSAFFHFFDVVRAVTCFVPEVNSVSDRLQALDKGDLQKTHTRTFSTVMLTDKDIEQLPTRPAKYAPKKKMRFS